MNNVMGEQGSWILRLPTKPDKPGPEAFHPACGRVHKRRDCGLVEVERHTPLRRNALGEIIGGGHKRTHLVPAELAPKDEKPKRKTRARKH